MKDSAGRIVLAHVPGVLVENRYAPTDGRYDVLTWRPQFPLDRFPRTAPPLPSGETFRQNCLPGRHRILKGATARQAGCPPLGRRELTIINSPMFSGVMRPRSLPKRSTTGKAGKALCCMS
jgi:hypothetical protein